MQPKVPHQAAEGDASHFSTASLLLNDLASKRPPEHKHSNYSNSSATAPLQVLLLYFSGHGVRINGKQFAVGKDSGLANVYDEFVRELNSKVTNAAIILIMDACGENYHSDGAGAAPNEEQKKALQGRRVFQKESAEGATGGAQSNGNVVACAYACQVGIAATFLDRA